MGYTTPALTSPESITGANSQEQLKSLTDAYIGLRRELSYLLTHLNKGNGDAVVADVLINKIFSNDTGLLTGTMPNNGAQSITPTAAGVAITAGYHNGTGGTIADADLVTGNVKAGITIFEVAGKTEVVDTTEATVPIAAATVVSGKKGFVNGALITGTMLVFVAGDAVFAIGSANGSSNDQGYGTIVGDYDVVYGGVYRAKFELKDLYAGYLAYGKIYKNGSAIGTERINSTTTFVEYSEDFTLAAGDNIQLSVHVGTPGYTVAWQNFKLYTQALYTKIT